MDAFPAFVPLAGARVVVAGCGPAADAKARLFDGAPAALVRLADAEAVTAQSCAGARLVFIAGDDEAALRAAAARARGAGAWVNVVDRPALCDFNTPSIVDRGAVVGAIGTAGAAPVLAVRLRQELEARWPERLGALARLLGGLRAPALERGLGMDARRRLFGRVLDGPAAALALAGDEEGALALALAALDAPAPAPGPVAVIAAPPAPDLLTLRAARRLGAAERVFAGAEVHAAVIALARRDAPRETPTEAAVAHAARAGELCALVVADAQRWAARLRARGLEAEPLA